jgi:hypothetical protein
MEFGVQQLLQSFTSAPNPRVVKFDFERLEFLKEAVHGQCVLCRQKPTLTGAGARSAEGTNTGHENGEAMASVGVRVERPVRHGIDSSD